MDIATVRQFRAEALKKVHGQLGAMSRDYREWLHNTYPNPTKAQIGFHERMVREIKSIPLTEWVLIAQKPMPRDPLVLLKKLKPFQVYTAKINGAETVAISENQTTPI